MKFKKYISAIGIISIVASAGSLSFAFDDANKKIEVTQEAKENQLENKENGVTQEAKENQLENKENEVTQEAKENQLENKEIEVTQEAKENQLENKEFNEALDTYISAKYGEALESDRISIKNDIIKYADEVGVGSSDIPYFYECVDIARKIDKYIIEKNKQDINENEDKLNYILDNFDDIVKSTGLSEFEVRERVLSLIPEENNENIIKNVNSKLGTGIPLNKGLKSRAASYSYNEAKAISYAKQYYKTNNSSVYPVFGADCANFVSQCLQNGGVQEVHGSVTANSSWFCDSKNANDTHKISSTWRGAQSFRWHWAERAKGGSTVVSKSNYNTQSKFVSNIYNKAAKGDAISLINSQGMAFHTIIITDRNTSSKKMSYAAHSDNWSGDLYERVNSSSTSSIRIYSI